MIHTEILNQRQKFIKDFGKEPNTVVLNQRHKEKLKEDYMNVKGREEKDFQKAKKYAGMDVLWKEEYKKEKPICLFLI